eukprot:2548368-Amphidinium_carterae.1
MFTSFGLVSAVCCLHLQFKRSTHVAPQVLAPNFMPPEALKYMCGGRRRSITFELLNFKSWVGGMGEICKGLNIKTKSGKKR